MPRRRQCRGAQRGAGLTAVPSEAPHPSKLKAIGWSVAFLLLGFAFSILIYVGYSIARFGSIAAAPSGAAAAGAESLVAQGCCALGGFLLATWVIGIRVLHLSASDLRWRAAGRRGFPAGLVLGAAAALVSLLLAVPAGGGWSADAGTLGDYLGRVALTLVALAAPAMAEEVAFRGVPLVLLSRALGRWTGVIALAALFALAHILNPGVTPFALTNILFAGVLLGTAFFTPGGIWTAFGAHLGWNVALAAADAPVSGLPFAIPFIDHHAGTPAWLTGGAFGPEGGLTATLAIAAAVAVALRWTRKDIG